MKVLLYRLALLAAVMSVEYLGAAAAAAAKPKFNDVILIIDTRSTDEVVPDSDALLTPLSQGVTQKCAPIIVAAPILKKYCEKHAITPCGDKALNDSADGWFIFKNKRGNFYLLVPGNYLIVRCGGGGKVVEAVKKIGFNVDNLETTLTKELINVAADVVFKMEDITKFFRQQAYPGDEIKKLLKTDNLLEEDFQKLKEFFGAQDAEPKWLFYWMGHGSAASAGAGEEIKSESATIAGLEFKDFTAMIKFFNDKLKTTFVYYISCFAGGYNMAFVKLALEFIRPQFFLAAGSTTDKSVIATADDNAVKIDEFFKGLHTFFALPATSASIDAILKSVTEHADETSWYNNAPLVAIPGGSVVSAANIDDAVLVLGPVTARKLEITDGALDATTRSTILLATDRFSRILKLKDATLISILEPELSGGAIKKDYVATHYFERIESHDNTFDQVVAKHFLYGLGKHPKRFLIKKLVCKNLGVTGSETEEYDDVIIEGKIPGNVVVTFDKIKEKSWVKDYLDKRGKNYLIVPFAHLIEKINDQGLFHQIIDFMSSLLVNFNVGETDREGFSFSRIGQNKHWMQHESVKGSTIYTSFTKYFNEDNYRNIHKLADEIIAGLIAPKGLEHREKPAFLKIIEANQLSFEAFKTKLNTDIDFFILSIKNEKVEAAINPIQHRISFNRTLAIDVQEMAVARLNNTLCGMKGIKLNKIDLDSVGICTMPVISIDDLAAAWKIYCDGCSKKELALKLLTFDDATMQFPGKYNSQFNVDLLLKDPATEESQSFEKTVPDFTLMKVNNFETSANALKIKLIDEATQWAKKYVDIEEFLKNADNSIKNQYEEYKSPPKKKTLTQNEIEAIKKEKDELVKAFRNGFLGEMLGGVTLDKTYDVYMSLGCNMKDFRAIKPFDDYVKAFDVGVGAGAIKAMLEKKAGLIGQLIGAFDKTKTALGNLSGEFGALK